MNPRLVKNNFALSQVPSRVLCDGASRFLSTSAAHNRRSSWASMEVLRHPEIMDQRSGNKFIAGENIPPNECESLSVKLMRLEMVSHGARSVNQSRKATVKSCADADGQQVQTGSLSTVIRLS